MFPHKIVDVDEKLNIELKDHFKGIYSGLCQVGKKKWILPKLYKNQAEGFYDMEIRSDDIFLITFPRSGTTVMQEMIWLINNNLDYDKALENSLFSRFPFIDFSVIIHPELVEEVKQYNDDVEPIAKLMIPSYEQMKQFKSPRHIKTHLPFDLLPQNLLENCKVIYMARTPKDVIVSFYHHNKLIRNINYSGDLDKYADFFIKDLVIYTPYWEHLEEGWNRRHHKNMLFLFYEDFIQDPCKIITEVSKFLNKSLTEEQIKKLADHLHIDNFRKNPSVKSIINLKGMANPSEKPFIREGKIAESHDFSEKTNKEVETWINNKRKTIKFTFPLI